MNRHVFTLNNFKLTFSKNREEPRPELQLRRVDGCHRKPIGVCCGSPATWKYSRHASVSHHHASSLGNMLKKDSRADVRVQESCQDGGREKVSVPAVGQTTEDEEQSIRKLSCFGLSALRFLLCVRRHQFYSFFQRAF